MAHAVGGTGGTGGTGGAPARGEAPGLRQLLTGLTAVRDGDFGTRLPEDTEGLLGEIASVFNGMVDQLALFTSEVTRVAREVGTDGRLGGQAEVPGVFGTWADLTDSVNAMAGNLTTQVRDIAQVATAVARGDLSRKIDVAARGEILELKNTLNTMVDQLSAFAAEVTRVAREVGTEGRLGGQADVRDVSGTWRDLTESVNVMANNLTSQVRNIAQVTTAVAGGDLSQKIRVEAKGEVAALAGVINTMVDQLSSFAAEVTRVAREVGTEGRLGGQADVQGVAGTWKRLTENVNELAGNLTRQVRAIAEVTGAVAEGDLTRSITVEASGEVAELKDNINTMVQSLRESTRANREQDWLKSNLAAVTGLTQGRRDLAVVAGLVMDELTPLVRAQYGAFFLAEESEDGTELKLIASYGDPADPRDPRSFRLGQSLVGQAARSRRIIAVDELPPDYVQISSGLGSVVPTSLVVLPIAVEDLVLGVIEVASVHTFTAVQRAFLEQLTEAIGVNLNTIVANTRTDELLGEFQRLTVELQAQQQELQSSNEELEEKAALLASQNRDIEAKNLEIEQARQELEERARQLALASTYKSEFLANMSHELRTPLNSLLILARLLAQNAAHNLTPKQVEYAEVIHSAGSDLLQLIDDILDLSKVEAGKMALEPEPVSLPRLLDSLEAQFRPLTGQKGLHFSLTTEADVPDLLVTDAGRLQQVLRNLLSNAVKFTESGQVEIAIAHAAPTDVPGAVRGGPPVLAFRVADTGIGIPADRLEGIFGAFQQADGTTSRKYGGTGLGLSISREIAHLLGGEITAHSTVGAGSEFVLYLPVDLPDHRREHSAPAAERARKVLVVEEATRRVLRQVADGAVGDVPVSADGPVLVDSVPDAREAARAAAEADVRCIVLQLDLPDDGALRFLETVARDAALRDLPLLALQVPGLDPSYHRLLLDHARLHPLELITGLDELRRRVADHLSEQQQAESPTAHTQQQAAQAPRVHVEFPADDGQLLARTVLIIDDDPRNVFALTSMLEFYGMRVLVAGDGREGIRKLKENPGVDIILMDVMMPELDGYEATALIRADPAYAHIPIIAVTAKAMPGDREKSLAAGATDYLAKPVDVRILIERVRRHLVRAGSVGAAARRAERNEGREP